MRRTAPLSNFPSAFPSKPRAPAPLFQKANSLDNAKAEMNCCALGKSWTLAFGGNQDSNVGAPKKELGPYSTGAQYILHQNPPGGNWRLCQVSPTLILRSQRRGRELVIGKTHSTDPEQASPETCKAGEHMDEHRIL